MAKEAASKSSSSDSDPTKEAQAAVDAVAEGWRVDHAQAAQAVSTDAGTVLVKPAEYRAWKRGDTTLIEVTGDSPEQLAARIEDWEASQFPTEPQVATEEQIMNSAQATIHMAMTSDARPAIDVDVQTEPAPEKEAKQKRLVVKPNVEEVPLEKEEQTLKQPASTGVGSAQT